MRATSISASPSGDRPGPSPAVLAAASTPAAPPPVPAIASPGLARGPTAGPSVGRRVTHIAGQMAGRRAEAGHRPAGRRLVAPPADLHLIGLLLAAQPGGAIDPAAVGAALLLQIMHQLMHQDAARPNAVGRVQAVVQID